MEKSSSKVETSSPNSSSKATWTKTFVGTAVFAAAAIIVGGIGAHTLKNTSYFASSQSNFTTELSSYTTPTQTSAALLDHAFVPASAASALYVAKSGLGPVAATTATPAAGTKSPYSSFEMPADFVPSNADGSTENAPFARINLPTMASGQQAIASLGADLPAVAQWYGMSSAEFSQFLLTDTSAHVDRKGRVLHIDTGAGPVKVERNNETLNNETLAAPNAQEGQQVTADGDKATATVSATSGAPFPLSETFTLHSRSKSSRVLFLNFQGEGQKPPFDLDNNVGTTSTAEAQMIQRIWLRVAEDYAAFDVDVTTERPSSVTGKIGATIVITNEVSQAGGYAYLNSFSKFKIDPAPAFCFPNNLANSEKPIAECISHELGHTLGLNHQGTATVTYHGGVGTGETGWAPIMGVSYYKNLTQWAKGEFTGATNKIDAYALMAKQGLLPRTDDFGNARTAATGMVRKEANGLANLSVDGVIGTPSDVDVFSFTGAIGDVSFSALPSAYSGNVDIELRLEDSTGKLIGSANTAETLGTTLKAKLAATGTYFLSVKGAGKGTPATGYSNYGCIGQYSITGTAALAPLAPAKPPVALIKTNAIKGTGPLSITFDGSGSTASGSTIAKYEWNFGEGTSIATTSLAKYTYTKAGTFKAVLKVTSAAGQSTSSMVVITVTLPPPAKK